MKISIIVISLFSVLAAFGDVHAEKDDTPVLRTRDLKGKKKSKKSSKNIKSTPLYNRASY